MKKRIAKTLSIFDLFEMFPEEAQAVQWYEQYRWGGKPVCPHCHGTDRVNTDKSNKYYYHCKDCRKRFSVKVGTVMESSNIPVRKWLFGMYLVLTDRKGISSLELSKLLKITQKSAWFLLHRIRESCVENSLTLSDVVEVDETYVGGKEGNKHAKKKLKSGRGVANKQPVLGMRQRNGKVKAMPVPNTTREVLQGEIVGTVEFGSVIYTDDHRSYIGLNKYPYTHQVVKHSEGEFIDGDVHTNGIESVWAVLKRGYNGTYHRWSNKHCHRYVNEIAFRLNDGNCEIDTIDRMVSMVKGSVGKRLKYKDLIK